MVNCREFFLGDSVYLLKPYLITPFSNPETSHQKRFNKRHSQTRMFVERGFGELKRRFPLLSKGCRFRKAEDCAMIILTAFKLHNMILHFKDSENEVNAQCSNVIINDEYSGELIIDDSSGVSDNEQLETVRGNRDSVQVRND